MAIDRVSYFINQRLTTMPHVQPGWSWVTAAEKAVIDANGTGQDAYEDQRRLIHIKKLPPKVPTP